MHRALVNIEEDRYDDAISHLQDVIRREPGAANGFLELGRALVHQHRYEEALPVLRTAAERRPDSGMAHYELALALIKTGQWEAALPVSTWTSGAIILMRPTANSRSACRFIRLEMSGIVCRSGSTK